ncbi:hypothetical protein Pmani_022781 [Petrolisthes manimaculis]|uniref:Uncharacterized protein n=1 Tax=Petrolisthes manimaculis TaxID=1843537 RepID=A0AAE1PDN0_9EUCA|nr:hypothetical protein Pmani_022781 [Petrolisthes manimaculis]
MVDRRKKVRGKELKAREKKREMEERREGRGEKDGEEGKERTEKDTAGFEELKKDDNDEEEEKAGHDIRKDKRKVSRCEGKEERD